MVCTHKKVATTGNPIFTVREMKTYLKIDDFDIEDSLIESLILAATTFAEAYCWRSFIAATYELITDSWDLATELPIGPVDSVTGVTYYDSNNDIQTLPTTRYILSDTDPATIFFLDEEALFENRGDKIKVTFTTVPDVPEPVKQAIRLQVGYWYENREDKPMGLMQASKLAMHPFRFWRH